VEVSSVKLQRIISFATLAISILTLVLVLKRPAPIAPAVAPALAAANAQSFQEKVNQLAQPKAPGGAESEVRMSSAEVSAALAQATGLMTSEGSGKPSASVPATGTPSAPSSPNAPMEFSGSVPDIKDYQVSMDGDIVRGQFLTQIAGKDVYLTLAGHLGSRDGYATFDATEVKVGDLSVPVSLVNGVLQKKLAEQRDQLKLPDNVKDIKVENGELVLVEK
jgi:cell division septation protein DedD